MTGDNTNKDVITSEKDIKSNAREGNVNSDVTKGDNIKKDIYNHSYDGKDLQTNLSLDRDWKAPIQGNGSFWEYVNDKAGAGMASNILDDSTVSPDSGYGSSYYDKFIVNESDYENLNEVRAREQGVISKTLSGTTNFAIKTATSFAGSYLSLVNGVYQGVKNVADEDDDTTFLSGFVNNYTQELIKDINEWGERFAPNYKGEKYQNMSPFAKLLTSTYWADYLNNMGFTSGMMLASITPVGWGGLFGRAGSFIASKLGASMKTADTVHRFIAGTMTAIPEAAMQGYNLYDENKNKYTNDINEKYTAKLNYLQDKIEEEESLYFYTGEEGHKNNIDELNKYYNEVQREYDEELKNADNRALSSGVASFGLNMAILPISNTLGMMSFLRTGSTNSNRLVQGAFGNMFRKKGTEKGISTLEARLIGAREMLTEGNEEMMQGWADKLSTEYYGLDYNPESSDEFSRFLNIAKDTFKSTYTDQSVIEEGIAGAIMGLTGAIAPHRDSNGKIRIFQGGLREAWREGKELADRSQRTYDEMNKVINDKNLANQVKLAMANLSVTQKQMELAANNDKKGYKDQQNMLAIKTIQTFANAGKLNDLEALVGEPIKMKDEEMQQVATMLAVPDPDKQGKYVPDNEFVDSNGELIPFSSKENKDKLRDKLEKRQSEFNRLIKDYRDALYEADKLTNFNLGQEQLNQIVWSITQNKNWRNRIKDMYDLPEFKKGLEVINANQNKLIAASQKARIQRDENIKDSNITSEKKANIDKAVKDREEYLNQMYNASIAFIEKHAQEIEREANELDERSEQYINAGHAFKEVEKRKFKKQQVESLRKLRSQQKELEEVKKELKDTEGNIPTGSTRSDLYKRYQQIISSMADEVKRLEESIEDTKIDREILKEEKKKASQEIMDDALLKSWETKEKADAKREEAKETRRKEIDEFVESGNYTKENDSEYQGKTRKQSELSKKLDYLAGLIEQANEVISKGEKALKSKKALESTGIKRKINQIKNLEELMNIINAGDLLTKMLDPNAKSIFEDLLTLSEYLEGMSASEIESFKNLLKDMQKCMNSYNQMDALIKDCVANPNRITSMQENVKNQRASQMAKETSEAIENELDDFDEDIILDENDIDNTAYSRLDNTQLDELKDKYNFLRERAEEMLEHQLIILGWDEEKRKKYAEKVVDSTINNYANKNENFDNFLKAIEASNGFSDYFNDIISNVRIRNINIEDIRPLTRQLFETANLYAYSHGFHPVFLSEDNIADLLKIMSDNETKYNLDDENVAAAYVCVVRIFDNMRKNLRDSNSFNDISVEINNGKLTNLNTGETFSIDNPINQETSNSDHTRDNTSQVSGTTIIGSLDGINPNNNTPTTPQTQQQTPQLPPQNNDSDNNGNNDIENTDITNNEEDDDKKALDVMILNPQKSFHAVSNIRTNVEDYDKEASNYIKQNGGYDFVNKGKLRELLEIKGGKVDVYASMIKGIGSYNSPVVFFFVKDENNKMQVIGYKTLEANSSRLAKNILTSHKDPNERITSKFNGRHINSNGEVVSSNINLRPDIKIGYKPIMLFNENNEPLRIIKVGNQGKILRSDTNSVSDIPVGESSFEYALRDGTVGLSWNKQVIGNNVEYDNKGTIVPLVLYKGDDGNFHRINVQSKPLSKVLQNDNNIMTKVFKKSLQKHIDNAISEFKKKNPNINFNDLRDYKNLNKKQRDDFNKTLSNEIKIFTSENIYSSYKSYNKNGTAYSTPLIEIDDINNEGNISAVRIKFFVTKQGENDRVLFEIPLTINDNSNSIKGASPEDYIKNIINQITDGFIKQEYITYEDTERVDTGRLSDLHKEGGEFEEVLPLAINMNKEYNEEYQNNLIDVANNLISSVRDFRPVNTMIGLAYQSKDEKYDNDSIKWSEYYKLRGEEFSGNKERYLIKINGLDYHFKRNEDSNGALLNEWTIYSGKPIGKEADKRDSNRVNKKEFLKQFDPDNLLNENEDALNEVLTTLFSFDMNKYSGMYVKTKYGYFDRFYGKMVKDVQGEIIDPNNIGSAKRIDDKTKQEVDTKKTGGTKIQQTPPEEKKGKSVDFNNLDDYDDNFNTKTSSNSSDDTIRLQNGIYNGILLLKQIKEKMFKKIKNLDSELVDFIENNISKRLKVKVLNEKQWEKYVELNPTAKNTKARYSHKNNCIYIKTNTDSVTIMHELTHAATVQAIKDAMSSGSVSISQLNEILVELQKKYRENPDIFKNIEGIQNFTKGDSDDLFEMVAEIIANKDLQRYLKGVVLDKKVINITKKIKIKTEEPKNLWEKLVRWIKNLINANKPQYKTETIDKLVDYTLFDKFKENVIKLQPNKPKESLSDRISNKIKRRSYNVQEVKSSDGISVYTSLNIGKTGKTINVDKFLNKYDFNGNRNSEWDKLINNFNIENDTNLNINDNSEFGKTNLLKFCEYLKDRNYEGIDLITGRDLSFSKYATDEKLIVFNSNNNTSNSEIANRLNTSVSEIENLNVENQYKLQHCI